MLKEMQIIWDKFQDPKLSLIDITEKEVLDLKIAVENIDSNNMTKEEKAVKELLYGANLEKHISVVGGIYDIFAYV